MSIEKEMESYFDQLFPICRSITGPGYRKSLEIISQIIPLDIIEFPSGTQCYDWTIPDEWDIREAYIITPRGEKIAQFSKNNLHVVGYSVPVDKELSLGELKKHLYYIESLPNAIPYVTSYYERNWGFCLPYMEYKNLQEGTYKVYIDSDLKPGNLTLGMVEIPGETGKEILISTYLCHPSMAVNELSGPLVAAFLYRNLISGENLRHTVRFVYCPENIGSIAFLSKYGEFLRNRLVAGYVVNCVGHGDSYTLKQSRDGNTVADRIAKNVLEHQNRPYTTIGFFPDGSDERQYCSPGFNFPVALIMRTMYGKYEEYHTSLDNKDLISFEVMKECVNTYANVIRSIDANREYLGRVQCGTPQLSKNKKSLYRSVMDRNSFSSNDNQTRMMLDILNYSDGKHDLLDIAEKCGYSLLELKQVADLLETNDYLVDQALTSPL